MKSRTLYFGLAALVLFQVTDLSRVVYTQFNLAPDCPIVGLASQSSECHQLACHSSPPFNDPSQSDLPGDRNSQPTSSNSPKQSECNTCQSFATIHNANVSLGNGVCLIQILISHETISSSSTPVVRSWSFANSRAPPTIALS